MIKRLHAPFRASISFVLKSVIYFSLFCIVTIHQITAQVFSEISTQIGITHYAVNDLYIGGGVGFADFNNDGWEDLYVCGGDLVDKIYLNENGQSFAEMINPGISMTANRVTNGIAFGDLDNDGDKDIFVATGNINAPTTNLLFINNGDSTFTDMSIQSGISVDTSWSCSVTMGDFNLDGYLDIYVGNYVDSLVFIEGDNEQSDDFGHIGFENTLFINNGDLSFTESSNDYGVHNNGNALAVTSSDFDLDFDQDIYVANDFGSGFKGNSMYQNMLPVDSFQYLPNGNGSDISIFAMGIAIGDYDEDLDLDYYVTNLGANSLLKNNSDDTFEDIAFSSGTINSHVDDKFATGWGTAFVDVDNDSYLDLLVANGHIPAADFIANTILDPNKLFKNNGDGTFTDISESANIGNTNRGRGLAYADFDKDGDIDFVVGNIHEHDEPEKRMEFYRNESNNSSNWLGVKLEGTVNNRDAYGAKVYVTANSRVFLQEKDGGSSHGSKNSDIIHFGLGTIDQVDKISVVWPGGAIQHVIPNDINTIIAIQEDQGLYPLPSPNFVVNTEGVTYQLSPETGKMTIYNFANDWNIVLKDSEDQTIYNTKLPGIHQISDDNILNGTFSLRMEQIGKDWFIIEN